MKKYLAFALALMLSLCVLCTGCGAANQGTSGGTSEKTESQGGTSGPQEDPQGGTSEPQEDPTLVRVTLQDTQEVLLNPGKGFVYYGGSSDTSKEVKYIAAIGYHRFSWADIEPNDGEYNFEKIDKQISYYKSIGKKFAFGVMCCNTSSHEEYITPKFVFDNGAEYDLSVDDTGAKQYIPKWKDEIFLEELDQFVTALGAYYNANENIEFIDILSYGNWGEQHLFGFHIDDEDYPYAARPEPEFIREHYIEPYMRAFPDILLVNPWGYEDLDDVYTALIEEGVSVRRDGICKYTNGLDVLAKAYGKLPVIFEYAGNYKDNIKEGTEAEFNQMLEEAIAAAKPSYIELDIDWFHNNRAYCEELANRMGYYFRLKSAAYHADLKDGEISLTFRNDGITPIYEPCRVFLALLKEDGTVAEKFETDFNPASWLPGENKEERFTINPKAPAGKYRLAVGLFRDAEDGNPCYRIGSEGGTEDGWYVLGNVTL